MSNLARRTTYVQRVQDALTVLCGGQRPPEEMVAAYIYTDDERLQSWAATHVVLDWAMGITTIDAAVALAQEPAGPPEQHLDKGDYLETIDVQTKEINHGNRSIQTRRAVPALGTDS